MRTFRSASPDTVCCVVTAKTQYSLANAQTYFSEHLAVGDFSPPKSVSIAALVVGDERIIESHRKAVRAALVEFETFAATRVRESKANDSRLTKNVVATLFTHDTSRALDPHLHTHCIVCNATHDPEEQRWKALQNHEMLRARKDVEGIRHTNCV